MSRRLRLLALVALVTLAGAAVAEHVIGVVDVEPAAAAALAAAAGGAARVVPVEPGEPLAVGRALCQLAAAGAVAALGGRGAGGALAAGAAARAGLPLMMVTADTPRLAVLSLYPHTDMLAEAGAALMVAKGWRRAVLLHEGGAGAAALGGAAGGALQLWARALPPAGQEALLRDLLLVLRAAGAQRFVVWASAGGTARLLQAALRASLLRAPHHYLLLTLDAHTAPLAAFSHGGANVTALSVVEPPQGAPPSAEVLAADAVRWAGGALRRLRLPLRRARSTRDYFTADCGPGGAALHADTLLNYLRSEAWRGAGGAARWGGAGGARVAGSGAWLAGGELQRGGRLAAVARWAGGGGGGVRWTRPAPTAPPAPSGDMTNRTFTILIAKNNPYVMMRESTKRLSGNERYEGFCVELIERLAEQLGFNYTFVEQLEGGYGKKDKTSGKWGGMLGRLINDSNIDFAITDLTITAEREQAVDFTTPFMNLGISILFRTPEPPEPQFFAFLLPFSTEVWVSLGAAYVGTSLVLYAVGRLSPDEWQNPFPCLEEPAVLHNQFTLPNALWFNLGAVLLQGSEVAPLGYGSRAVASAWWVFALVITSSYTANLATLLAKKTSNELLHDVTELAHNERGISYGATSEGSTYSFFEHSQNALYQEMYQHMKDQKMPKTNELGIEKVMKENYAFLMESTSIEYVTQRNCNVTQVGGLLDNKGYGIAMKKQSPYRQALNLALLKLQEAGELRAMKIKWWNEMHGGGACKGSDEFGGKSLSMQSFLGLFLVLGVGCALGLLAALAGLAWRAGSARRLAQELRFVFQFERSVKPLRPSGESSPSPPAPPAPDTPPPPSPGASLRSRRRRSSMAAASARLARHATLGSRRSSGK